jgi:hypothetical protein
MRDALVSWTFHFPLKRLRFYRRLSFFLFKSGKNRDFWGPAHFSLLGFASVGLLEGPPAAAKHAGIRMPPTAAGDFWGPGVVGKSDRPTVAGHARNITSPAGVREQG